MNPLNRLDLYTAMVRIRQYESRILREYHADKRPAFDIGAGLVPGEMHLSAGQEPVAAGVCAHLTRRRRHRHPPAAPLRDRPRRRHERDGGRDLRHGRPVWAAAGAATCTCSTPSAHFSCSGIIAEGYPPALGQAFAFKRQGTDRVAVAVTGEGAANQGAFHESLNLAALWKLPVVFVVEDNDWGISVPRAASTADRRRTPTAPRRTACPACGSRTTTSRRSTRPPARPSIGPAAGDGPTLIEVHTLRLWGHFEGDAQGYRGRPRGRARPRPDPDLRGTAARRTGCSTRTQIARIRTAAAAPGRGRDPVRQEQPAARPGRCHVLYVFA